MSNIDVSSISLGKEYDNKDVSVVGGYVRDSYMNRESNDVDLVVTGVTSEKMLDDKFKHVMSNDTKKPVFMDSDNREVAIARSEKSTGDSPNDFEMDIISPDVPHEKAMALDLERRDLTMNAIAVNVRTGKVYDPFNGREDIDNGVIRHVSDAFQEDALRVVRAARYASRFGFKIPPETIEMMIKTTDKVSSIPTPRFGLELVKVFKKAESPRRFFDILSEVGALSSSYPEIAALKRVPAGPEEYHKEGTAYEHTMRVVESMFKQQGNDVDSLLAALFHDVGKVTTSPDIYPHHYGHDKRGAKMADDINKRYEFVRERRGVISTAARTHMQLGKLESLNATTVLKYAKMIQKSPLSVEQMSELGLADAQGREPQGDFDRDKSNTYLNTAISVMEDIGGREALNSRGYTVSDVNDSIPGQRIENLIRQDRAEEFRKRLSL